MLLRCTPKLPDCFIKTADATGQSTQPPLAHKPTRLGLIGIDCSLARIASAMLKGSRCLPVSPTVHPGRESFGPNLGASSKAFRIGGRHGPGAQAGEAGDVAVIPAFQGAAAVTPQWLPALQTLWTCKPPGRSTPLCVLLVSDLEVNQSDISSLIGRCPKNLLKGGFRRVLALSCHPGAGLRCARCQYPYRKTQSALSYLLATGNPINVRAPCFQDIQRNMAKKRCSRPRNFRCSTAIQDCQTLTVKSAAGNPKPTRERQGSPVPPTEHHLLAK